MNRNRSNCAKMFFRLSCVGSNSKNIGSPISFFHKMSFKGTDKCMQSYGKTNFINNFWRFFQVFNVFDWTDSVQKPDLSSLWYSKSILRKKFGGHRTNKRKKNRAKCCNLAQISTNLRFACFWSCVTHLKLLWSDF